MGSDLHAIMRSVPRQRHQDGWVEKTGKQVKTWTGFYYQYELDANGNEKRKQRCKVLGFCKQMGKGEAEDKLRMLIRSHSKPVSTDSFETFARWYLRTKESYWATTTRRTMASIFEQQIIPVLGQKRAAEITKSEVELALGEIARKFDSESMLKKCLTHIRAVFQMGCDDEKLQVNPAMKAKMPPPRKVSERFLELEECRNLIRIASGRDRLIVRTFITLGLRPSELFALRRDDLLQGTIRIDQAVVIGVVGETKTEDSTASIPIPPALDADLRAYAATHSSEWLFPSELDTPLSHNNYLKRNLKRLGELARIDGLNFQVLRRTCATHFQQRHGKPKDAQSLLRHSSIETTMKHYVKEVDASLVTGLASWDAELTVQ